MKVLITSTYFHPYSSGLSVYALRLARGLVALGHEVCVLTSQYDQKLATEENLDGVQIRRRKSGNEAFQRCADAGFESPGEKVDRMGRCCERTHAAV